MTVDSARVDAHTVDGTPHTWYSLNLVGWGLAVDAAVKGAADGAVNGADDASTTIGYPPLHVHHLHVHHALESHWFETHGDYEQRGSEGYSHKLLPGYCSVHYGHETSIEAQLNDVRFAANMAMSFDPNGINRSVYRRDRTNGSSAELQWSHSKCRASSVGMSKLSPMPSQGPTAKASPADVPAQFNS